MITFTRRLASQLRSVLRRVLGNTRCTGPAVGFIGSKEGLIVKADCGDVFVEYRVPGNFSEEALWLPFDVLSDCEAKRDAPVTLELGSSGQITAQWQDRNGPQLVSYDAQPAPKKAPQLPTFFESNPPRLLQAIIEASDTCDANSVRYALTCMQISGSRGEIAATDGHQALIQSGFTFPWPDDLLLPRAKFLGSAELPKDQPVQIGKSGDYVVFGLGPWMFYLAVNKEGRFPKILDCVPAAASAKAVLRFSADDSKFIAENLPKLPGSESQNSPVTLDLNGHVAVRSKADKEKQPTELVLTNSCCSGKPLCIGIDRRFLARALRFGLTDLCICGESSVMLGHDEHCRYVWMPLIAGSEIEPTKDALRIESPKGSPAAPVQQPTTKETPMSEPTTTKPETTGQPRKISRRKAALQDLAALIQQAEQLRAAQREHLVQTNALLKGLKQHRRQNRAIQNTLESLKQLKTLGV